jgi:hypothetical protein
MQNMAQEEQLIWPFLRAKALASVKVGPSYLKPYEHV